MWRNSLIQEGEKRERTEQWMFPVLMSLTIAFLVAIVVLAIAWTRDGWSLGRAQSLSLLWIGALITAGFCVGNRVSSALKEERGMETGSAGTDTAATRAA